MSNTDNSTFLRRVLLVDSVMCVASGMLLAFGAGLLEGPLGISADFLRPVGFSLFPFAAFVAWLATRPSIIRPGVWAAIALNALWVLDSFVILVAGWIEPTALGVGFVIAQALAVAVITELEYMGLRRAEPVAA